MFMAMITLILIKIVGEEQSALIYSMMVVDLDRIYRNKITNTFFFQTLFYPQTFRHFFLC